MSGTSPEATKSASKLVWSANRLKKYLLCPRQYRYAYVEGIPSVPTAPLVLGQTLHEVVCSLHEWQMIEGELPDIEMVLGWFDGAWSDVLEQERPLFREGAPDAQACRTSGREMLRLYHGQQVEMPPPLLVELAFEIHFPDFILCGVIDRVDEGEGGLTVTDYKSGRKMTLEQAESDWQLSIYAYAVERIFGERVDGVRLRYLKDGSSQTSVRGEEDFRQLTQQVLPHVTLKVERGEFEPSPGYWCRWCDYRELCAIESSTQSGHTQSGQAEPER